MAKPRFCKDAFMNYEEIQHCRKNANIFTSILTTKFFLQEPPFGQKGGCPDDFIHFHMLELFLHGFSLHELASFVCPLVCVRGQGLLRFSVLFKFKFLHGHRLSAPSCDTFTASDCTHTITACSCDTFTASTLHAHHHGMLV